MQQLVNFPSTSHISTYSSNDTIFYNFVGNFVPPEWRDLTSNNMTNNVKNQQQVQEQLAEKGWIVKLSPVFATLVPVSSQATDIISNHENYVDITTFTNIQLE